MNGIIDTRQMPNAKFYKVYCIKYYNEIQMKKPRLSYRKSRPGIYLQLCPRQEVTHWNGYYGVWMAAVLTQCVLGWPPDWRCPTSQSLGCWESASHRHTPSVEEVACVAVREAEEQEETQFIHFFIQIIRRLENIIFCMQILIFACMGRGLPPQKGYIKNTLHPDRTHLNTFTTKHNRSYITLKGAQGTR